ncbi:hypothetical protein B0T24DRAFT_105684 [Lasiosphaeria ovina]|uniref:Secreted protein n=1 Tax=Lasiosphaeria ovina TaxID=92902 RepID=A0AAE0JVU5_9PEZI|nr:hypothetical protein B0T24DRAFT_105684 [Lasiosphaeria ovina]
MGTELAFLVPIFLVPLNSPAPAYSTYVSVHTPNQRGWAAIWARIIEQTTHHLKSEMALPGGSHGGLLVGPPRHPPAWPTGGNRNWCPVSQTVPAAPFSPRSAWRLHPLTTATLEMHSHFCCFCSGRCSSTCAGGPFPLVHL